LSDEKGAGWASFLRIVPLAARCTGYRGKCGLPYIREEELGNRLGQILKDIHIPDDVLAKLENS